MTLLRCYVLTLDSICKLCLKPPLCFISSESQAVGSQNAYTKNGSFYEPFLVLNIRTPYRISELFS